MAEFIVDPTNKFNAIVSPSGKLAGAVFMRPVDDEEADWQFVGFSDPDQEEA